VVAKSKVPDDGNITVHGNGSHVLGNPGQVERLEYIGRSLLEALGEDPQRPGLEDTPKRWARMWLEFVQYDPGTVDTAFEHMETDQMVVIRGMRVWSLCEHHLLPFSCDISVGYITTNRVLGLSKFARIAHQHAHRLQIQERLVADIADTIQEITGSDDVAVTGVGEHLCMTMRGIKTQASMITSVVRGRFRHDVAARAEFLGLAGQSNR